MRYALLDTVRGLTLCSMAAYHACWDIVFLLGAGWAWYQGPAGFLWQQSICWTFIFLSGFCWPLGRRQLRRGLVVFAAGALVSAATLLFSYESRVIFGVLSFLGCAMLVLTVLEPVLQKLPPAAGIFCCAALFALTRQINAGSIGFGPWRAQLPAWLYHGLFATFVGLQAPDFYSSDYFSLLPWLFLFLAGYFTCRRLRARHGGALPACFARGCAPLAFLGRHSLLLYLVHQPILYGVLMLAARLRS